MHCAIERPSPNFDERDAKVGIRYAVLHYTGMKTRDEALARLCDPEAKVSAHYVIDEKGRVYMLVDEPKRAWHAGKSFWRGATDINSASVGIELVNPGHEFGYKAFTAEQLCVLKDLLKGIVVRNALNPLTCLLGHSDVAPTRKTDPGELFPWQDFAAKGLGVWPEPTADDAADLREGEAETLLGTIGYDTTDAKAALLAFQRRYDPANLTGLPERETAGRLRALARKLKTM